MKTLSIFTAVLMLAYAAGGEEIDLAAHTKDLALTIRYHAGPLMFGDRLFVQVTLVNRGKDTIRAPVLGLLEFIATHPRSGLQHRCEGTAYPPGMMAGPPKVVSYPPNEPVTTIVDIPFQANVDMVENPVWKAVASGGDMQLHCIFHFGLGGGLKVASYPETLVIKPRPESEIAALKRFATYDKRIGEMTIRPSELGGIALAGLRTRTQTKELADSIKSGELAEIMQLTLMMQELKHDVVDREAKSQAVLDWVAAQPDIKRQWMARRLLSYQAILSPATVEKLRAIMNEPVRPIEL